MLHSPALGQTAVGNKPDVILVTEVERKPVKRGSGKQYDIAMTTYCHACIVLPRAGGPFVYIEACLS